MSAEHQDSTMTRRGVRARHAFDTAFRALDRLEAFRQLDDQWTSGGGVHVDLTGTSGSLAACALARLHLRHPRPTVVVVAEPEDAAHWHDDLNHLLGHDRVLRFHSWEILPYEFRHPGPESVGRRLETLWRCLAPDPPVVVTHVRALFEPTLPPEDLRQRMFEVRLGGEYALDELSARLVALGFRRVPLVEEVGTFSVRGGILDLFTYSSSEPLRIEFFGDTVESIRTFAVTTQRTTAKRDHCVILPSREVRAGGPEYEKGWDRAGWDAAWRDRVENDPERPGLEWLAGALGQRRGSLLDYFGRDLAIWTHDPTRLRHAADRFEEESQRFHARLASHLPDPPPPSQVYLPIERWHEAPVGGLHVWVYDLFVEATARGVRCDLAAVGPPSVGASVRRLSEELTAFEQQGYDVAIACDNEGQKRRLAEMLEDVHGTVEYIFPAPHAGFVLPDARFALLTEHEVFNRHKARFRRRKFQEGLALSSYTQLKKGDYVVHVDHGVARFRGLEAITVDGRRRDCLLLLYQGDDKLFVPIEEFDRVQKYSGQDARPALSKLGGTAWEKTKRRAKQALLAMAEDLIKLYAARKARPGHAFAEHGEWMAQLESSFIYEETPDQEKAIAAVSEDMTAPTPMERLICGDVGYGKTEVAIRAAFRAVCDHKQVAVLVPTTILAQQHLTTFRERLSEFPVRIETLSRFRSPKEQKRIVAEVAAGKVDIIIGTHRLLQKDVVFHDLGLLIIDEEQRFGVGHKERLRQMRQTVDTLALSATPIPRTLQMSLLGARDLSLITTSPRDRLPVQTEIRPFGPEVVSEAILRELDRGGQVYFVHNRIQTIGTMADFLARLLPTVRIGVAHGEMPERELEAVMTRFYHGDYHVLLSTAIIESGLDIPSVNTIVIHRADRFGLAQLYQLRGRVGRSARQAYAYLLVPPSGALSATAKARLRAIEEHTALGSGFHLAMRDMEIRGAGNLLGAQQHGFIEEIGFDLYCRLLDEAVAEARGSAPMLAQAPVQIDVDGDRFIPDGYITDNQQRFEMYKRLAEMNSPAAVDDLALELTDRFGAPPAEVRRLLAMARVRVLARRARVAQASARGNLWAVTFVPEAPVTRAQIETWRLALGDRASFVSGPPFAITVRPPMGQSADLAGLVRIVGILAGEPESGVIDGVSGAQGTVGAGGAIG